MPRYLLIAAFFAATLPSVAVQSQVVVGGQQPALPPGTTYPSQTYYLALDLYREGRFEDALEGFQQAIRNGRTTINGRTLDSIPAIAMLGECWYQKGNLLLAQEQFDMVFQIMSREDGWMTSLQWPPNVLPNPNAGQGNAPRGPRAIVPGMVPTRIVLAVGILDQTAALARGTLATPELIPVDAVEILRGVAIALYRRGDILGPLNVDEPTVERMMISLGPARLPTGWPRSILATLTGLVQWLDGQHEVAATTLQASISLPGGLDHPLSPLARIVLARLMHRAGQSAAATQLLMDATTSAAIWSQPEWLAESLLQGVGPALVSQQTTELHASATAATLAMGRDFRAAGALANLVAAELAAGSGKLDEANRRLKDVLPLFAGRRQVGPPRLHAHGQYVNAVAAAASGRPVDAVNALGLALTFMKGTQQNAASPRLYQLGRLQLAMRNANIGDQTAEKHLDTLLGTGDPLLWQCDPLDALTVETSNLSGYYSALVEIARRKGKDIELIGRGDALLRHRARRSDLLGGRLNDVRWLSAVDPVWLAKPLQELRKNPPLQVVPLIQAASDANKLGDQFAAIPLGPDPKLASQRRELLTQLTQTADVAEGRAMHLSVSRQVMPQVFPPPLDANALKETIPEGGALLAFFPLGNQLAGVLATRSGLSVWTVPGTGLLNQIQGLLAAVGANRDPAANQKDWQPFSQAIAELVFPKNWTLPKNIQRVVIVPTDILWFVPFELLPVSPTGSPLGEIAICSYSATVGLAVHPVPVGPSLGTNGYVENRLLAPKNPEQDLRLVKEIADSAAPAASLAADLAGSGRMASVALRNLWVLAPDSLENAAKGTWSPLVYDRTLPGGLLSDWCRFPSRSPGSVFLPGLGATAWNSVSADGLFQVAAGLNAAGVPHALISRWPVGGGSTADLLKETLQELPEQGFVQAWHRARALLWSKQLDGAAEPIVIQNVEGSYSGKAPRFWAGYIPVAGF